jgi:hypothetical protein
MAAQELGLKVIPVICVDHLTPDQVRAYRLADNKIALNADWDEGLLKVELEYLFSAEVDFDVDLTGFSTPEIDLILHSDPVPETEDEFIPAPDPDSAVCQTGDLWCLGQNKAIVGDCRDPLIVDRLVEGKKAKAAYLDAPYNTKIHGFVSGLGKHQHREFKFASGEMSEEEFIQFLSEAMQQVTRVSADGSLHFWFPTGGTHLNS